MDVGSGVWALLRGRTMCRGYCFGAAVFSFLALGFEALAGLAAAWAFFEVLAGFFPVATGLSPYFFMNRSTLPALSTSFCFPVKKG